MEEQGAAGGATAAGGEGDELHGGTPVEGGVGEGRAQEIEGAVVGSAKVLDGAHPDPAKSFLELDNIAGTNCHTEQSRWANTRGLPEKPR
jgi:hypothetical protein